MVMPKKRSRKRSMFDHEDCCFVCKDGGNLIPCGRLFCQKSYHQECVGKDSSAFHGWNYWSCDCHNCSICQKPPTVYCYCCTKSFCENCYKDADFVLIRINKGLCSSCLSLIHFLEDEGPVYPYNKYSDEWFLKKYWDVKKKEDGLDLELIYSAEAQSDNNLDRYAVHNPEKINHLKDFVKFDPKGESGPMVKGEALEIVGWASKPLVDFLQSVGEDTSKQKLLSDVQNIISRYIEENNLYDLTEKKVVCDDKLQSIFGKRSIYKSRVHPLLELHCAINDTGGDESNNKRRRKKRVSSKVSKEQDTLSKEAILFKESQNDTGGDESNNKRRRKKRVSSTVSKEQDTLSKEAILFKESQSPLTQDPPVHKSQNSCFASIVAENMKLVYLRRSLVEELKKEPESFEDNVVGSFVDVKVDKRKCNYQLLPVTGVKKHSADSEVLLEVATLPAPISISVLCDTNFNEQDLEVLQQKVKSGILRQPTVVHLEKKARMLHQLITKDYIKCELIRLDRWIDHTNEKGRRAETMLKAMLQRDQLLRQSEQEKLLGQIPKVIAEEIEVQSEQEKLLGQIPKVIAEEIEVQSEQEKLLGQIPKVIAEEIEVQSEQEKLLLGQIPKVIAEEIEVQSEQEKLLGQIPKVIAEEIDVQSEQEKLLGQIPKVIAEEIEVQSEQEKLLGQIPKVIAEEIEVQSEQEKLLGQIPKVIAEEIEVQSEQEKLLGQIPKVIAEEIEVQSEQEKLLGQIPKVIAEEIEVQSEQEKLLGQISKVIAEEIEVQSEQEKLLGQIPKVIAEEIEVQSEQEKLLGQIPKVIAEEIEVETDNNLDSYAVHNPGKINHLKDFVKFDLKDESGPMVKGEALPSKPLVDFLQNRQNSCFASIVAENMKLVYLRRSLVEELKKEPESFEDNVVGSFVDVKVDKRKCNYQLLPVTGVKKHSADSEVLLEVATLPAPVSISVLCDTNFYEQDLEVLQQKVKSGILRQPTVVHLENKARMLHQLITKDYIKCELIRLDRWIDHTNEKGRRAETMLKAMLQRDQLLRQSEQEKLLGQIPKVIAEEIEVQSEQEKLLGQIPKVIAEEIEVETDFKRVSTSNKS